MAKSVLANSIISNSTNAKRIECKALVLYISREDWIKSILDRAKQKENDVFSDEEEITDYPFEDDLDFLRSLDPKVWKDQDHYAVLGIKNLRHRATEDMIKRAYKHKILKHHPDKRKAQGEEIRSDDDYFTCITKAWETLGNPTKRRSYDSIDPYFNDELPEERKVKENFYYVLGKAFRENARWSCKKPVPKLGHPHTSKEKVEKFYSFWYDFESWREYSYLDEGDKESGQDRDERKYIEKQNKAIRAKRKKEEMLRIRTLVDMAYNLDPRIKIFQQQDKDRKTAAKRAKQEAIRAKQLEEERLLKEAQEKERIEKEKRDAEEKARLDAIKQAREAKKKALRKEKKALRDFCKSQSYFANNPEESIKHMENVEKICESFEITQLEEAMKRLKVDGKEAFLSLVEEAEKKIEAERKDTRIITIDARSSGEKLAKSHTTPWTENEIQLLIKAVNLFPAGTNQRWEVVANFINQHNNSNMLTHLKRDAKEVLAKAKDLQSKDYSKSKLKEKANKKAFDNFIAENKAKDKLEELMPSETTERLDHPIRNGEPTEMKDISKKEKEVVVPWTPAEQKLLEQALKTYSNSVPDRWDQIASCIPTRTKKECMKRYKELVELVKAKKAAQVLKQ